MDTEEPKEPTESDQPEELADLTGSDVPTVDKNASLKVEEVPIEKSNKKLFIVGAVITGVVIVLAVGFFLTQRKNITQPSETPHPSVMPSSSPAPTPKPKFNRAEWSLEVLNGTEVTGAAKKLADKLIELGYKIVKTGNADRSDYEKTTLWVSKDLKDREDKLILDIKDAIKIASSAGELKDSTASARIIIGKDFSH